MLSSLLALASLLYRGGFGQWTGPWILCQDQIWTPRGEIVRGQLEVMETLDNFVTVKSSDSATGHRILPEIMMQKPLDVQVKCTCFVNFYAHHTAMIGKLFES